LSPAATRSHAFSAVASAWRGRATAAALVGAYFLALLARGGHRAWGHFGVWALSPRFLDLRSVTSAWECARRGLAVMPVNPCDPLGRPANYPSIWLLPSHLGLGVGSTEVLGFATAVCFFVAALSVVPSGASVVHGCLYGLALCSPAVMLGVERGNADLLVFGVLVAGLALLHRSVGGSILLLFAAVLKLFPILAAPVLLLIPGHRARYAAGAVPVAFAVYVLTTLGTVREILHVVPQTAAYSYGAKTFGSWAANLSATYRLNVSAAAWDWITIGLAVALAVVLRARVRGQLAIDSPAPDVHRDLDFFVAGACIYVGTFALAENWDYRLAFLLLTIPQLFRWARAGRILGIAGLSLVLASLWLTAPWYGVPVVHSIVGRWEWLTEARPFFGADLPLSAAASAQVLLAIVLIVLVAAALPATGLLRPMILRRRHTTASA